MTINKHKKVHREHLKLHRIPSLLGKLRLDDIPTEWVDSVFFCNFTDFEDLPNELLSTLESIEIRNVFESLLEFMDDVKVTGEQAWASTAKVFSNQKLLALLCRFLKYGTDNVTEREHRVNALLAARVYFRFLMIPGSKAYEIYQPRLFAHSISCLGFPKLMCEKTDCYTTARHLSNDINLVVKELSPYVNELKETVLVLQLTPVDMDFERILSNLIDVSGSSITQTLHNVDVYMLSHIVSVIYQVIGCMLNSYGEQPNPMALELLFKCLVPKLIAYTLDNKTTTGYVRASYVTYAGYILSIYPKAAMKSFIIMLQHICYSPESLERAEARNARADLVIGLMSLLPDRRHRKFVKWILLLSTTAKIVHRNIALEILSRLLINEPEINEQRENIRNEIEKQNAAAQALPIGAAAAANAEPMDDDTSQDSQESQDNGEVEEMEQDEEGEGVAGLMRRAPHTVPLGAILHAVYECALDTASSVRQRALAVLAESVASDRTHLRTAIQELNGDGTVSRLMALGARCVCDERAVVRRAAAVLVLRLILADAAPPAPNDLAILVKLCRDAAITVRSTAISALGDLLVNRQGETVLDAFLSGPLRQLFDNEDKVKDIVKSHIDQILIKRLMKYTKDSNEDKLPWMFLEGIIKNNMRRNLEKACKMLSKSDKCISVRLVDILSSHLGVVDKRRDLQCLVLLTSVARLVDYSDVAFALEYYYEMTAPNQELAVNEHDPRIITMVLHLLGTWSPFVKEHDRVKLRDYLVARLATGINDGCRISTIMLARALDPDNIVWSSEILQRTQEHALENDSLEDAMLVADLSLIAPVIPSPRILQMFLSALTADPPYISEARAGECVVGAGRMCLRSRDSAEAAAPLFAALLHSNAPLPARINAMQALVDLTRRYVNIMEPLLGAISRCLEVEMPTRLRRAASRSLTGLLLSEFLRLRKPLYYNYFALIVDADNEVREPAEYYVTSCLKSSVIFLNFVDCVLYYNSSEEKLDFDARQLIYDVMLQRLTIVERLNTQCKLAQEILQHAANLVTQEEEIPATLHAALLDTIKLLIGPRMKLPKKPQHSGDFADIEDIQERVTSNIVSHKMKRTVAEVMVPAVLRLYAKLGKGGGQLAAYLIMLVQELEVEYKEEIEELIETDEELVTRIAEFRENHSVQSTAGNMRNLVTSSGPPEPETPKPQRKRAPRRELPKKRALKI